LAGYKNINSICFPRLSEEGGMLQNASTFTTGTLKLTYRIEAITALANRV